MITTHNDVRLFQVRAGTADEDASSVEATIATERPTLISDGYKTIDEVLLVDACELPRQVILLNSHTRGLDDVFGSVREIRVLGDKIVAQICFSRTDPVAEQIFAKVRDGHITDVSVGYRVEEATDIAAGQTAVVFGRNFAAKNRPLRVVTKWTIKECSIVAIGVDVDAKFRSDSLSYERDSMSSPTITREPVDNLCDVFQSLIERSSGTITLPDLCKAMILTGNALAVDTTAGWTQRVPLDNFRLAELFTQSEGGRLTLVPRGGTAGDVGSALVSTPWRLKRYGGRFEFDEHDTVDGQRVGAVEFILRGLGEASAAMVPDAVYSLLISNPALESDSKAIFHVDHDNLTANALDAIDGAATRWMLAARAGNWPTIVVGSLDGRLQPQIRPYTLDQERWGFG